MLDALPTRAFFHFEFPILHMPRLPMVDGNISKWHQKYMLPSLAELDEECFADVYAAWNADGLVLAFDVPERHARLQSDTTHWWKQDGLRICVDTRDARDLRRGTRFCHFFYVLPTGGGPDQSAPVVASHRLSRARENPPAVDTSKIKVAVQRQRGRYAIELFLPAACLHGWDPAEHERIGIYYKIKDLQHGVQHLTVTDDFGWNADPSTWASALLLRQSGHA
ncbi:MAG: hypothetical protein JXO22_14650 [Phycisphaerae bacterium]|nr:hypothetical protein [Phycisphaerae bacterium]